MKDIKEKQISRSVKKLDKENNIKYFLKNNDIKSKDKKADNEDKSYSPRNNAIKKVENTEKAAGYKLLKNNKIIFNQRKSSGFSIIKKESFENKKIKSKENKAVSKTDKISTKSSLKKNSYSLKQDNYNNKMKSLVYSKQKKKIKSPDTLKNKISKIKSVGKCTVNTIRKTIKSTHILIKGSMRILLIIVVSLFVGVFSSLSNDTGSNTSTETLSQEVLGYRLIIEKYANQYDIKDYVSLIMAVMMQESGGKGLDPMQSSECEYNIKYPKQPDGITDAEYSIDCDIHYLSDCLKLANVSSPSDIDNISLGLQGYNFGKGYISWAVQYFGGYTSANAKVYSDQKKMKLGADVYGDPDYVVHVLRYYHIGNMGIVEVAKSQVGNVGGEIYWEWYGFENHVNWCACFVSWCANESGDLNVTVPKFSRVEDGIQWFKDNNRWEDNSYLPNLGDLIFFDWNNDKDPDHVGIVESTDNMYVYTVEGNSNDMCKEKKYLISRGVIYGYGKTNFNIEPYINID